MGKDGHHGGEPSKDGSTPSSPDLDLKLELVPELLADPLTDQLDQFEDVGRPRARLGDDEVGVAVGDLGASGTLALQARTLDQGPGR